MPDSDRGPDEGRRRFVSRLSLGLIGAAALGAAVPVLGYLIRPARAREIETAWRDVGAPADFPIGVTRKVIYPDPDPDPWEGVAVRNAAWVRRVGPTSFVAYSVYCTHTGCPVEFVQSASLFLCPCHGGVFDGDGAVLSGPPPRPLDRVPVRVQDGRVEVRTSPVPSQD